jgi:hypothetical protein
MTVDLVFSTTTAKFSSPFPKALNSNLPNILLFIAIFFFVLHLSSRLPAPVVSRSHVASLTYCIPCVPFSLATQHTFSSHPLLTGFPALAPLQQLCNSLALVERRCQTRKKFTKES